MNPVLVVCSDQRAPPDLSALQVLQVWMASLVQKEIMVLKESQAHQDSKATLELRVLPVPRVQLAHQETKVL